MISSHDYQLRLRIFDGCQLTLSVKENKNLKCLDAMVKDAATSYK